MCCVLGIGLGAEVVAGFADAHHQALAAGFPDTVDTYGLISGLWTSVFALGIECNPFCFLNFTFDKDISPNKSNLR